MDISRRQTIRLEFCNELIPLFSLQSYFEDNPRDLQVLRHDKSLHTVKSSSHLKDVPDYLSK